MKKSISDKVAQLLAMYTKREIEYKKAILTAGNVLQSQPDGAILFHLNKDVILAQEKFIAIQDELKDFLLNNNLIFFAHDCFHTVISLDFEQDEMDAYNNTRSVNEMRFLDRSPPLLYLDGPLDTEVATLLNHAYFAINEELVIPEEHRQFIVAISLRQLKDKIRNLWFVNTVNREGHIFSFIAADSNTPLNKVVLYLNDTLPINEVAA